MNLSAIIKGIPVVASLFIAQNVSSGNLVLTSAGEAVNDGDVIEIGYTLEDYSSYGIDMFVYNWNPHLELATAGVNRSVTVTVTADERTDYFSLCWPMSCQMVRPGQPLEVTGDVSGQPADLQLHGSMTTYSAEDKPAEIGSVKVRIDSGDETLECEVRCMPIDVNGVEDVMADSNDYDDIEYYMLTGTRVLRPCGGLYIVKRGNSVTKAYIR